MEEDLVKLRGSRRVYMHHIENMFTYITNLIQDFDFGNEQHTVETKTLRASFSNKIEQIKLPDSHILTLLKTENLKTNLMRLLQKIIKTQILTKIVQVFLKIQMKESQNIPPVPCLTLKENEAKRIPVKLLKLQISKFNGNILTWQNF